jgi:hypothetical protein
MRVSTYQKKMADVLKHRPRFESQSVNATVTLTGEQNEPIIDVELGEKVVSMDVNEAKEFANWIKKVAR